MSHEYVNEILKEASGIKNLKRIHRGLKRRFLSGQLKGEGAKRTVKQLKNIERLGRRSKHHLKETRRVMNVKNDIAPYLNILGMKY